MAVKLRAAERLSPEKSTAESGVTTSIIVPAYNEEKGIPVTLEGIFNAVDGACEVLVVDDGSVDTTSEVASLFPCHIIRHEENRGKGEALKTGIKHASGEYVIFIDADGTYPADVIPQICEALVSCDIVYGSRTIGRHNIPRFNLIGNIVFQNMIRHIYGFKASDYATGLYGIRKHYLEMMDINSRGFAIEPEIAIKASRMKLRVQEIPIAYQSRIGKAKLNGLNAGFEHLRTILRLAFWNLSPNTR